MSHITEHDPVSSDSSAPDRAFQSRSAFAENHDLEPSADDLNAHRTYLLKVAADLLKPELRPKVSPSDLVQESIIIAIRKFQSFHGSSPHQLRAWLEAILRRKYCNFQRVFYRNARHAIRKEISIEAIRSEGQKWDLADDRPVDPGVIRSARLDRIRSEVRNLSSAEAEVFTLRMEHDLSVAEIAERFGITEACVHKRYQRAVRHLYERLHESVDSDADAR